MTETAPPSPKGTEKPAKSGGGMIPGIGADASVSIGKLVTEKFTFTNARGALSLSNGIVNLKNFSVDAFNGNIQSKGMLDLRDTAKNPFDLNLTITNVEANSMLPQFTSFGNYLHGKLSMTTAMKGDLNDTMGLNTRTLLGNGNVHIADGKVLGLPLAEKLAAFTNLSELRQIDFKDWMNAFSIENGRFTVKNFTVNAGTTTILVGGSQGLDGSLDYTLTLKLPSSISDRLTLPGIAKELLPYLKDKEGRINLSLAATGTASDPTIRLDTEAQQNLAKQAVDQKKQQLLDDAKKKAEDALKNLFKRP
jgi:AsmA protein